MCKLGYERAKLTYHVNCTRGVKQWDVCNSVILSLFIYELALETIENGRSGATVNPGVV